MCRGDVKGITLLTTSSYPLGKQPKETFRETLYLSVTTLKSHTYKHLFPTYWSNIGIYKGVFLQPPRYKRGELHFLQSNVGTEMV